MIVCKDKAERATLQILEGVMDCEPGIAFGKIGVVLWVICSNLVVAGDVWRVAAAILSTTFTVCAVVEDPFTICSLKSVL